MAWEPRPTWDFGAAMAPDATNDDMNVNGLPTDSDSDSDDDDENGWVSMPGDGSEMEMERNDLVNPGSRSEHNDDDSSIRLERDDELALPVDMHVRPSRAEPAPPPPPEPPVRAREPHDRRHHSPLVSEDTMTGVSTTSEFDWRLSRGGPGDDMTSRSHAANALERDVVRILDDTDLNRSALAFVPRCTEKEPVAYAPTALNTHARRKLETKLLLGDNYENLPRDPRTGRVRCLVCEIADNAYGQDAELNEAVYQILQFYDQEIRSTRDRLRIYRIQAQVFNTRVVTNSRKHNPDSPLEKWSVATLLYHYEVGCGAESVLSKIDKRLAFIEDHADKLETEGVWVRKFVDNHMTNEVSVNPSMLRAHNQMIGNYIKLTTLRQKQIEMELKLKDKGNKEGDKSKYLNAVPGMTSIPGVAPQGGAVGYGGRRVMPSMASVVRNQMNNRTGGPSFADNRAQDKAAYGNNSRRVFGDKSSAHDPSKITIY